MSDAPRESGAAGGIGDLSEIDRALLTAIGRRQNLGKSQPLTPDEERLLDDWIGGRLSPADADRAALLVGRNAFAAERVLERRMIEASQTGPGVPPELSARILTLGAASERRTVRRSDQASMWSWLASLSSLQWSAMGAAAAAVLAFAAISVPALKERWQSGPQQQAQLPAAPPDQPAPAQPERRIQLAMVTIDDRAPLSGRTSSREIRRPVEGGFSDVEIPTGALRSIVADAGGADRTIAAQRLAPYWPALAGGGEPAQVLIDAALPAKLDGDWKNEDKAAVRIFDLNHPGSALVRRALNVPAVSGPLLLLTPVPPPT